MRRQCHPVEMNCNCKRLLFSTESTTLRQLLLQTILAKIDPNRLGFINIPLLCLEKQIDIFFLLGIKSGTGWSIRWKLMRHFATLAASSVVDACSNPRGPSLYAKRVSWLETRNSSEKRLPQACWFERSFGVLCHVERKRKSVNKQKGNFHITQFKCNRKEQVLYFIPYRCYF